MDIIGDETIRAPSATGGGSEPCPVTKSSLNRERGIPMNPRHIILPSVFPAFVLTIGCASDGSRSTNERHATLLSQEQARHLVLTYRRQATDLRELVQAGIHPIPIRSFAGSGKGLCGPRLKTPRPGHGNINSRSPMDKSSDEASQATFQEVKLRQQRVVRHN